MVLRELVSEIRQSVYAVLIEWATPQDGQPRLQAVGTAFAVSSDGHFVSANHVINLNQGQPPGRALTPQDKIMLAQIQPDGMTPSIRGPFQILADSSVHDYVILHMPGPIVDTQKYLQMDLGPRFEGEEVAICGYPLAASQLHAANNSITIQLNLRVAAGIISSQRTDGGSKMIEVDFPILPGNSGGPLFSLRTGKVLGLSSATMSVQGGPPGGVLGHIGIVKDIRNAVTELKKHLPYL